MSLLREEDGVELGEKATGHKETAAAGRPVLLDHGFIGTAKQNEVSVRIADIQVPTALRTPGGSYAFASLPEKLTREVEEERDGDEDRPSDEEETEDEMDLDSLHSFMVVLPPAVDRSNEAEVHESQVLLYLLIAMSAILLAYSCLISNDPVTSAAVFVAFIAAATLGCYGIYAQNRRALAVFMAAEGYNVLYHTMHLYSQIDVFHIVFGLAVLYVCFAYRSTLMYSWYMTVRDAQFFQEFA